MKKIAFAPPTFCAAIISLMIIFCSCNPKKEAYYLDKDLKEYFHYEKGTYWVLYDSLNHHVDSIAVRGYTVELPHSNGTIADERVLIIASNYNVDIPADSLSWDMNLAFQKGSSLTIAHGGSKLINYPFPAGMPFSVGTINYPGKEINSDCHLLPTYNVNNITYNDVYEIIFHHTNSSNIDHFYLNKDHGFIKVILNNKYFHRNLYLVRNKIVR